MQEKAKPRVSKLTILFAVISVIAIGASATFYFLYANKQSESAKQQQMVEKIGKTVELPGEQPSIITINDKSKLANKQLVEKVDNGDVLLVFAEAKRLVIYRPSNGKVMNMLSFANTDAIPTNQSSTKK